MILMRNSLSCLILCDPMDSIPPGSSLHRIPQARILEWVTFPFSKLSSLPRDRTWVSCSAGRLYHLSHQEAYVILKNPLKKEENFITCHSVLGFLLPQFNILIKPWKEVLSDLIINLEITQSWEGWLISQNPHSKRCQ